MLRKKNTVLAIVSVMVLGLLVTGVVGLAGGNGRGNGAGDGTGTGNSFERDSDGDGILNHEDSDYDPGDSCYLDDDGDGIPNCEDPDYERPEDGSGNAWGGNGGRNW